MMKSLESSPTAPERTPSRTSRWWCAALYSALLVTVSVLALLSLPRWEDGCEVAGVTSFPTALGALVLLGALLVTSLLSSPVRSRVRLPRTVLVLLGLVLLLAMVFGFFSLSEWALVNDVNLSRLLGAEEPAGINCFW